VPTSEKATQPVGIATNRTIEPCTRVTAITASGGAVRHISVLELTDTGLSHG
jgi:hypothetical protein